MMPRPVSITCSEMVSENRRDNQLSIFGLVEMIKVASRPAAGSVPPSPSIRSTVVAIWMKNPEDEGVDFEEQIVFHLPGDEVEVVAAEVKFSFSEGKPLHRIVVELCGWPPLKNSGVFRIECRVRPVGEETWTASQEYPIVVDASELESPSEVTAEAQND